MDKKRLILDVSEAVHSRLKAEAAQAGIHLGPYCAALLENSFGESSPKQISVEFDTDQLRTMPLNLLRDLRVSLSEKMPEMWKRKVAIVDAEITRRYRI